MNWSYIQPTTFNPNHPNPNYQKDIIFNPNLPLKDNLDKLNRSTSNNQELAKQIANMTNSQNLKSLLHSYGLDIKNVTWEDTARNKNSSWGPNISDMTLRSEQTNMPVIRRPNFSDVTIDHSINNFNVTVGNESNSKLERIRLTDYFFNINKYTSNPNISKLFKDDEEVLCSTQACLLPAAESEVNFNVRLFNYQSSLTNPAVLVIVASNQGTSSMVLNSNTTDILFNSSGRGFDFVAERLKEERKRLGKDLDAPMSTEEKERNVLFIYQIPLKQKIIPQIQKCYGSLDSVGAIYDLNNDNNQYFNNRPPKLKKKSSSNNKYNLFNFSNTSNDLENNIMSFDTYDNSQLDSITTKVNGLQDSSPTFSRGTTNQKKEKIGLDNAMLRVSDKDRGSFEGTKSLSLERDFRYPIRCTLQYYWITDTEKISQEQITQIASQLETFYSNSSNKSSLVYGQTNRSTEPKTNIIKENPLFTNCLNKFF